MSNNTKDKTIYSDRRE